MEKSKLYTRTGDTGMTSLVGGERVRKTCARLEAYGAVDELSAHLGVVIAAQDCPEENRQQLLDVQNMLFNIGGYLASAVKGDEKPEAWVLCDKHIAQLEDWIDRLDAETPKVNAFVLPGGTQTSAFAHVARTVCRRCECRVIHLAEQEYVDPRVISYLNRLSDYLFILARRINHAAGVPEILWRQD